MRKFWGVLIALALVLIPALGVDVAAQVGLTGTWQGRQGLQQWTVRFMPNGTFSRTVATAPNQVHREQGSYRIQGNGLHVQVQGEAQGYVIQFRLADADTLDLFEDGKQLIRLTRARTPDNRRVPPKPGPGPVYRTKVPYQDRGAAGNIVFTRWEVFTVPVGGRKLPVPTPKLYIMDGNGGNPQPFIYPPAFDMAMTPNWSPGYKYLLFSSNFQMARSALFTDIFAMDRATGSIRRLTGNEWSAGPVKGYGMVVGSILDDSIGKEDRQEGLPSAFLNLKTELNISFQGGGGIIYKPKKTAAELKEDNPTWDPEDYMDVDPYKWLFILPRVPAGKVWIKCWKDKSAGDLLVVDVEPNTVTEVEMVLSRGNRWVSQPSISPDGRYLVAMSHHSYFRPASPVNGEYSIKPDTSNTIAVADLTLPGGLPMVWNRIRAGGRMAKSPRLSPSGSLVAVASGKTETLENLAICSLVSILRGFPQPRVLVPSQRIFPSAQNLIAGQMANDWPAWSPDSRRLAFVRSLFTANGNLYANLFVVNADGSGMRQLTQVGPNQAVAYPSWSPDGRHIAFQVITGKGRTLNITDFAVYNYTSDIYVISAGGGGMRRLTTDGRSSEPAWGP